MENERHGIEKLLEFAESLNIIEPADIPAIDLYMDQLTTFMNTKLSAYKRGESDKILTKTMINNYTKNKLLPIPNKKKYAPRQLELLVALYHLKNALSMDDLNALLHKEKGLWAVTQSDGDTGFYEAFVAIQEEAMARVKADIQKCASKTPQAGSHKPEEPAFALIALQLALSASISIRITERIIDEFI